MMTIKEFLKRNEKIREITEAYKIDIDCFDIKKLILRKILSLKQKKIA